MATFDWYPVLVAGVFGAVLGSFLNVVIYRLPLGRSIVRPGSSCPGCNAPVAWYDNIPVFSYVFLGGRCRRCKARISARYPVVELVSAAAAAGVVWYYGPTLQAVWIYAFLAIMLAITLIDWDHQIIPDPLSLGGVVLGWVGAAVCLDIGIVQSFVGSLAGAGVILLVAGLYKAVRKVDGMGGGDVKLMAMIGAFLGWQMVLPVLFLAALFGSLYGAWLIRSGGHGKTAVAFGSFLAPAACVMLFFGERLLDLYLGLGRP
ncbi:MAG: prepilin peptidase [Candidatus Latescibacterota bacterium]|jgi:leader peptidase (prepilin peptidase)/N-methyltransferase